MLWRGWQGQRHVLAQIETAGLYVGDGKDQYVLHPRLIGLGIAGECGAKAGQPVAGRRLRSRWCHLQWKKLR